MLLRRTRRWGFWPVGAVSLCAVVLTLALPGIAGAGSDLGTADNPVRLSASGQAVPEMQILADALQAATGFDFVVDSVDPGGKAVAWLCDAYPDTGMLIMSEVEFVFANDICGADTRLNMVRFGSGTFRTEFIVPNDSALLAIEDLAGLTWHFSNTASLTSYVVPLHMLTLASVDVVASPVASGDHRGVVQAVYDNSVGSVSPPVFGSTFVDARTMLLSDHPDVMSEVRVLLESPALPHGPIAFGPGFPTDVRSTIEDALVAMADPGSPDYMAFEDSFGMMYSATGLADVTVADFAFLWAAVQTADVYDFDQGSFTDDNDSIFEKDIEWLAAEGITKGCNPPVNDEFCPDAYVTRGQMAAFLSRALGYTVQADDPFFDDDGNTFEADIEKLAAAGVTKGCNPPTNTMYCPFNTVTRGQMAAFLVRALGYTDDGGGNLFSDDDGSVFEKDIDRLGTAGVTKGCNPPANTMFCPDSYVTRGQMAAFLQRALSPG